MKPSLPISLVVLTHNEEANIEYTLESARGLVREIVIVDSFSDDRTLEICRRYTDRVYQHAFENQAKQFNWALDNLELNGEWVIRLDSDEMLTPELVEEFRSELPRLPLDVTGITMKRRVFFMGRWIRHGDYYPMWFLRTFRRGKGRYEEITEEHIVLSEGRAVRFRHDFIDYNRKGLSFWVDKHNHWAVGEMLDTLGMMGHGQLPEGTVEPSLLGRQEQRRRWLKMNVYARFPLLLRPFLYFGYRYFLKFGFLDGKQGLIFHFLQGCFYRFLVDAKIYEALTLGIDRAEVSRQYSGTKPWQDLVRKEEPAGRAGAGGGAGAA